MKLWEGNLKKIETSQWSCMKQLSIQSDMAHPLSLIKWFPIIYLTPDSRHEFSPFIFLRVNEQWMVNFKLRIRSGFLFFHSLPLYWADTLCIYRIWPKASTSSFLPFAFYMGILQLTVSKWLRRDRLLF